MFFLSKNNNLKESKTSIRRGRIKIFVQACLKYKQLVNCSYTILFNNRSYYNIAIKVVNCYKSTFLVSLYTTKYSNDSIIGGSRWGCKHGNHYLTREHFSTLVDIQRINKINLFHHYNDNVYSYIQKYFLKTQPLVESSFIWNVDKELYQARNFGKKHNAKYGYFSKFPIELLKNTNNITASNYVLPADMTILNFLKFLNVTERSLKAKYSNPRPSLKKTIGGEVLTVFSPNNNLNDLISMFRRSHQEFLTNLFKEPTTLVQVNYANSFPLRFLFNEGNNVLRRFSFLVKTRVAAQIVGSFLSFLKHKDPRVLIKVIVGSFQKVHYSKHKPIFRMWEFFIKHYADKYLLAYNVAGIKLEFRGKLGVGGNSRKRAYIFRVGLSSNSSKITKSLLQQDIVRTTTGVFSCNLSIFF